MIFSFLRSYRATLFFFISCSCFATGQAYGQFTTILNIPPDPDIGHFQTVGSSTQVNLFDGGTIGLFFVAGASNGTITNVEVNISGGLSIGLFEANSGSVVNISGGVAGQIFDVFSGSKVNLSGGTIGWGFKSYSGSEVNISGGEYRLDGVLLSGLGTVGSTLPFNLPEGSVLSGTLTDGTPFAFSSFALDSFAVGTLTLKAAALPPIGPVVTVLPGDPVPSGVRNGQTLVVGEGGNLDHPYFTAGWGSAVNITGGQVGAYFEAVGALVTISGGSVGPVFRALRGSTMNISGGSFGTSFGAFDGSFLDISGGLFDDGFKSSSGSAVNISGGEFRLDGAPLPMGSSIPINLPVGSVLSGTFADGKAIVFSSSNSDSFSDGTLTLSTVPLPHPGPSLIVLPSDPVPPSVRPDQTLVITDGGVVGDNFTANWGSTVNITGGQMGENFEAVGAQINISGGSVGRFFDALRGSEVDISGGSLGGGSSASNGSEVNIAGGSVAAGFSANSGSVVNISGGSIDELFKAYRGSVVNISGGIIGNRFNANPFSEVNLIGTQFLLNGIDITASLTSNTPFTITDRDVTLTGLLADASPFIFELNSSNDGGGDWFHPLALLTVSLAVPEPATILLTATALFALSLRRNTR